MKQYKKLNRRTWAIMVIVANPWVRKRCPRITQEAIRLKLIGPND